MVEDIKLQRSPLQNSNFVITLSVGFVLTVCSGLVLFCAGTFGALKPGFRSLVTLKRVVNVGGEL